ncbi:DedA family protein [Arthrobacter sp. STN4]|uniref:DedA family protein n=1 Tax=Arthrobacter sp. STN4 TaxID=2923276 RepID=UPI00211A0AE9|nr:VTT domain-containing protein [Arthrobacter sp. STN4]MCQ9163262.1 VTT domain-containing protein [Arthrobacter sp. STN4]
MILSALGEFALPALMGHGPAPTLSILPPWLNPDVFLRDPALAPWIILLVCGIVFAETGLLVGFFLPGDSMLFTAGLLVATGALDIPLPFFALCIFVAAFIGDQTGFFIGHKAGPAIFNKPDSRLFKQSHVARAHAFFERFGGRAVILARFVPIVRTFVPVIAGVAKMPYRTFIGFNAIGAALWGIGVTLLGFWLGQYSWVGDNIDLIFIAIVLLSVIPIITELTKAFLANRRASKA